MVITFSLQITNHIFTTIINHQAYEKCACPVRTNMFSSSNVCKFCQLKRCQREELWLLSLLWSLSDDGVNPNLLDVPESIFNSFVFNLGFISSIPLYLRGVGGKVKPKHRGVTKLVYCLLLMPPLLPTSGCGGHILLSIPKLKRTTVWATCHTICHDLDAVVYLGEP